MVLITPVPFVAVGTMIAVTKESHGPGLAAETRILPVLALLLRLAS